MRFKRTLGERLFDRLNYVLLALVSAAMLLPFVNVLASSLSTGVGLSRGVLFSGRVAGHWRHTAIFSNKGI